jgi:hypothetical protein
MAGKAAGKRQRRDFRHGVGIYALMRTAVISNKRIAARVPPLHKVSFAVA